MQTTWKEMLEEGEENEPTEERKRHGARQSINRSTTRNRESLLGGGSGGF
jgi:hypothetical protein